MVQPTAIDDDDLLPELTPLDGLASEENYQPEDDDDLGLGSDEDPGLDVDSGPLEPIEPELDEDDERDGSWLDDGREAPIDADDDLETDADDDALWSDGSEPLAGDADPDAWEDELELEDGAQPQDNGEEGFRDDAVISGLELERLPPLDDRPDIDEALDGDALALELFDHLAADGERVADAAAGPAIEELARSGRPIGKLLFAGDTALIWDDALNLAPNAAVDASALGAELAGPLLAWAELAGAVVAVATPNGLLRSLDRGRSFEPVSAAGLPQPVASLAIAARRQGERWLAAPAEGPLFASDDGGENFRELLPHARVLRIAADDAGAVVVFGRAADASAVALRSRDGGETFTEVKLPVSEPERLQDLQVAGETLLFARRSPAPQLHVLHAGRLRELPADAAAPALLLREGTELAVYFWQPAGSGTRLARAGVGSAGEPESIAELPADAGSPLQLCGAHAAGVTTLVIGCERALLRLRTRREDRTT